MQIDNLKNNIVQDSFVVNNKRYYLEKITAFDECISVYIQELCFSDSVVPYGFQVKYYFKIYFGGDECEIFNSKYIPKYTDKKIRKTFLGFIPYMGKEKNPVYISLYNNEHRIFNINYNIFKKGMTNLQYIAALTHTENEYDNVKKNFDYMLNMYKEFKYKN